MIRKSKKQGYSVRNRLLAGVLLFLVPLTTLLLVYNFYSVSLLREKTAISNQNSLLVYSEIVEAQLQAINVNLIDVTVNNSGFYTARNSDDRLKVYLAAFDIFESLQTRIVQNPSIDMYFAFIRGFNREIFSNDTFNRLSFDDRMNLHDDLLALIADRPAFYGQQWTWIEVAGQKYLMRIIGSNGVYIGALVSLENLVYPLAKSQLFEDYQMIFSTIDGVPLTGQTLIEENSIQLDAINENYYLSGRKNRFLVIGTPINRTNIRMIALIPDPTYLTGLNTIQIMLFVLSLIAVLAIPLVVAFLRKAFVKPLNRLVLTMNQIQDGNLDARINDPYVADEFSQVNNTFNGMISQIQDLKISSYEKELARQRAELQYLHFQIRPHFFLNSLKVLFNMAERGKTAVIQEIILALSNHFRYMFKDNFSQVTLREELNYVKNYIRIQQLYRADKFTCEIDVDENLMDLKVLPLTIQTFVENSIKHGQRADKPLTIVIRGRYLQTEDGPFASLVIEDNGPGFSPEILPGLNFSEPEDWDELHIGLNNVRQRLAIKYQDKSHLAFANSKSGGAVIEMILPISSDDDGGQMV